MKQSLLNGYTSFLFVGILSSTWMACKKPNPRSADEMPPLFPEPKVVPYNADGGYITNQLTGDSILPIINKVGDTIQTGISITIKGQVIRPDSSNVTWIPFSDNASFPYDKNSNGPKRDKKGWIIPPDIAKKPNSIFVTGLKSKPFNKSETIISGSLQQKIIDESTLKKFTIGVDTGIKTVHHSNKGVIIKTGEPFQMQGKVIPCLFPPIIPAGLPRYSDNAKFDLQYLNTEEGMKSSNCFQMIQDQLGYFWIGYPTGVSRYDGSSFLHFSKKEGFSDFGVSAFALDKKGNLWMSSNDRIICYNGSTCTHYTDDDGLGTYGIRHMIVDHEGILWLATNSGLVKFEPNTDLHIGKVTFFGRQEGLLENQINYVYEDSKGSLWIGSPHSLSRFEPPRNEQKGVITYYTSMEGFKNRGVSAILEDRKGQLWFGEVASGLSRYQRPVNGQIGLLTRFTSKEGFCDAQVKDLLEDNEGNIWIGTLGEGIFRFSQNNIENKLIETFTHYGEENGIGGTINHPKLLDSAGNLWITTAANGLYRFKQHSFANLDDKDDLLKNIVNVLKDKNKNIWLSSWGNGFFKLENHAYHNQGWIINYLLEADSSNNTNNFINDMLIDTKGNLWLGTRRCLALFEPKVGKQGRLTYFYYENGIHGQVRKILENPKGGLWMATKSGIAKYDYTDDPRYGIFTQYNMYVSGLPSSDAYDIFLDKKGTIWIATPKGIIHFDSIDDSPNLIATYITEKEGLSSNATYSVCEDMNGLLWIGTDKGLNIFKRPGYQSNGQFTWIKEEEGLSGSKVVAIVSGPETNGESKVWVKTENGIDIFTISRNNIEPERIVSVGKADGLLPNRYLSMNIDENGNLILGSEQGVTSLDKNAFNIPAIKPKLNLHAIDINGAHINYRNLNDSLRQRIVFDSIVNFENYPHAPVFSYKYNHLTFHYSAIDWSAPHKIRYSYKMDGLENEWSVPNTEIQADYRKLPSGTFTFKVRAIGESQIWSEPFEYKFTIRPPWWYSWWAIVMYTCFGGFIVYRTYRFQLNRKLEIAEKQRLVELDQIKNRLYTNITHEFRTPLTLIHGPVTQALSKNTVLEQKDIQSIHRQSERLQQLINQMLQLQKLEAGMLKPHYAYGEIIQVLRNLFGSFETWAKDKNISMLFSSSLQEVYMDFDQEKLTQIISNLVSNAIKHTPRGGKVAMVINPSSSADFLLINISDTGTGISEEDLPYIFDRFYQSKRASSGGTGIGLALVKNLTDLLGGQISVESKLDSGSTFKLSLPVTKRTHKPAEAVPATEVSVHEAHDEEINFITPQHVIPGKPIVLIVEDHPEVLQYVASCLADEYTILSAKDGNEGLRLAYERVPDLIISDVMMPGKDGFELCNILKTDIQTSHIPIILLTGRGDHEAMMEGIGRGADAYVTKPFDPEELLLRVRKLLELRSTLSQYYRQHATTQNPETIQQSSAKENEFLQKIRAFVEEHLNDSRFNMDMLCHQMAMSHPQLHRKITALTGESTGKFVRSVRLAKALELLRHSDLTISEIAYETGFSEPGYFTKVFSKEFNSSPTEYRSGMSG